jgi:nucleotide-binding universal stress UspA family protein
MKTIAVLTDFSERSEHAARYALHLAQKIKANILLFNAFLVPSDLSIASQVTLPVLDYIDIKKDTEKALRALCTKLENELKDGGLTKNYLPNINYQCEEGILANAIAELEEDKDIILMVFATHGADDPSAFMMGNNCRQVIGAATIPLLIVPENAPVKDAGKFAFATDISHGDVPYITALAGLAKQFTAEIIIANVNAQGQFNSEHEAAVALFMSEIEHNVDYKQISYLNIANNSIKKGLEWLIENVKFDMLVMVHRKSSFLEFFFKSSVTKKIATHTPVPLLVYPYPASYIPSF